MWILAYQQMYNSMCNNDVSSQFFSYIVTFTLYNLPFFFFIDWHGVVLFIKSCSVLHEWDLRKNHRWFMRRKFSEKKFTNKPKKDFFSDNKKKKTTEKKRLKEKQRSESKWYWWNGWNERRKTSVIKSKERLLQIFVCFPIQLQEKEILKNWSFSKKQIWWNLQLQLYC